MRDVPVSDSAHPGLQTTVIPLRAALPHEGETFTNRLEKTNNPKIQLLRNQGWKYPLIPQQKSFFIDEIFYKNIKCIGNITLSYEKIYTMEQQDAEIFIQNFLYTTLELNKEDKRLKFLMENYYYGMRFYFLDVVQASLKEQYTVLGCDTNAELFMEDDFVRDEKLIFKVIVCNITVRDPFDRIFVLPGSIQSKYEVCGDCFKCPPENIRPTSPELEKLCLGNEDQVLSNECILLPVRTQKQIAVPKSQPPSNHSLLARNNSIFRQRMSAGLVATALVVLIGSLLLAPVTCGGSVPAGVTFFIMLCCIADAVKPIQEPQTLYRPSWFQQRSKKVDATEQYSRGSKQLTHSHSE